MSGKKEVTVEEMALSQLNKHINNAICGNCAETDKWNLQEVNEIIRSITVLHSGVEELKELRHSQGTEGMMKAVMEPEVLKKVAKKK